MSDMAFQEALASLLPYVAIFVFGVVMGSVATSNIDSRDCSDGDRKNS